MPRIVRSNQERRQAAQEAVEIRRELQQLERELRAEWRDRLSGQGQNDQLEAASDSDEE